MTYPARVAAFVLVVVSTALSALATAQAPPSEFRGTVLDSASGVPIAGAVVTAIDASGRSVRRTISSASGSFRMLWDSTAVQVRAVRLGFRPATERVGTLQNNLATVHLLMTAVPRSLEAMDVSAARGCPDRADRAEAFGLLDQVRAGLLATVVARERQPAVLRVLQYERLLDLDGLAIEQQRVRIDSSINVTTSFNAVHTAIDFVQLGFRVGRNGRYTYYGPDADVLLDARFQNGYCFSLAAADSVRPHVIGLRFSPANRRSGRVDIDGTLWVDTTAHALANIEFRYVGAEVLAESFGAGGQIGFRTLPSGVPFIDRWSLRLVGAPDTLQTEQGTTSQTYAIREIGGELAAARWPDGQSWHAPLATAHFSVVTATGQPAAGVVLRFANTDYRAMTDREGRVAISDVLPGPYDVVVDDPHLQSIGLQLPTGRALVAKRGSSIITRLELTSLARHVETLCVASGVRPSDALILARVMLPNGTAVSGAKWRLSELSNGRWRVVTDGGFTGSSGVLQACKGVHVGSTIELAVWQVASEAVRVRRMLTDTVTVMSVTLPALSTVATKSSSVAPTTADREVTDKPNAITVSGVVRDSAIGAPVAEARVTFLGTPFEGASDSAGRFTIGGLVPGSYLVEVSTPWLDSIGAVRRTTVSLPVSSQPLTLFVPTVRDVFAATCGASDSTGAVVGHVSTPVSTVMSAAMRVVAEWSTVPDSAPPIQREAVTMQWVQAPVETQGLYRLCGVPVNRAFTLRAETDSGPALASVPVTMQVSDQRLLARADLSADTVVVTLPAFTGAVIADSVGTPLENAEVTLMDLSRTVLTKQNGAFRMRDVPVGSHVVRIKRLGYAPFVATIEFVAGRTVEHRVLLVRGAALATVSVIGQGVPVAFEERRRLGLGRYITTEDLMKYKGRRFGDILNEVSGFANPQGVGGRAFVVTKRLTTRALPKTMAQVQNTDGVAADGIRRVSCGANAVQSCPAITPEDFENQGYFCPGAVERAQGITQCACFAQVYVDDRLMNPGRPTDPFDVNTIPISELAGVEFYPTAASTPGQYSGLNAKCGVMLVWTRQR